MKMVIGWVFKSALWFSGLMVLTVMVCAHWAAPVTVFTKLWWAYGLVGGVVALINWDEVVRLLEASGH